MTNIVLEDLPKIRRKHKNKKIVFCSGCFDLTHAGHVLFFEDCKKIGDILVVAIGTDNSIRRYKGDKRPILNENVRLKVVDALKPVDYTFLDMDAYESDNKFVLLSLVFKDLKPDYYVFNEDAYGIPEREEISKKYGVEMKVLKRWCPEEFEEISTSKIIEKIKALK